MNIDVTQCEGAEWLPQGETPSVEVCAPRVIVGMKDPMRPSHLPFDAEFAPGPAVAFMVEGYHDGTQLLTLLAVSAAVECAEGYAAKKGGAWKISPVRLTFDHPTVRGRLMQHEIIAVAIREA